MPNSRDFGRSSLERARLQTCPKCIINIVVIVSGAARFLRQKESKDDSDMGVDGFPPTHRDKTAVNGAQLAIP